ncbi:hypothetical protein H5968_09360 [Sphaerospermopsis sp. LEGE 00249]|uniref:hypothetical protein n=1 Tax=Sphaerospermopsis sp. LEGE 00249 TaxID=1380707 RepID=UPI00164CDEDA|nr:hypothetical protein [Sphaerospermopsis sp. LEGE 00249]MBC5795350.1 hypothetical protein [Sphaerospermopsis sp. LEGE 00249]
MKFGNCIASLSAIPIAIAFSSLSTSAYATVSIYAIAIAIAIAITIAGAFASVYASAYSLFITIILGLKYGLSGVVFGIIKWILCILFILAYFDAKKKLEKESIGKWKQFFIYAGTSLLGIFLGWLGYQFFPQLHPDIWL